MAGPADTEAFLVVVVCSAKSRLCRMFQALERDAGELGVSAASAEAVMRNFVLKSIEM